MSESGAAVRNTRQRSAVSALLGEMEGFHSARGPARDAPAAR